METIAISLVVPGASTPKGRLHTFNFTKFIDGVCDTLIGTGLVSKAYLGSDISFNDFSARGLHDCWQAHAYGFCQTSDREKLSEALSKAFPATTTVPHPVRTRRFDGSARAASYSLKFQFVRRVSYRDDSGRWNTKTRRLQAHEHTELMLALSQLGLAGRLALVGDDLAEFGEASM